MQCVFVPSKLKTDKIQPQTLYLPGRYSHDGGEWCMGGVAWKECCIQGVYCIGVCGMGVLHRGVA